LKTLIIGTECGDTILDFKFKSESLQSICLVDWDSDDYNDGPVVRALDVNCPALTTLDMRIVLKVFDQSQFVRSTSYHLIEDMHLTFDMIDGRHTEADPLVGKRFIKMLGQMQSLKKLRLDDMSKNILADMHLGEASFEQTLI